MVDYKKLFFTSDLHIGHSNIIKYCNRPFSNTDNMVSEIIDRWNKVVSNKDTIWLLGDIFLCKSELAHEFLNSVNYSQIGIVLGNHDKLIKSNKSLRERFTWVKDYYTLKVPHPNGEYRDNEYDKVILFHYPILSWDGMHHGSYMLHGHSHNSLNLQYNKILDTGVDGWDFTPVSFTQIKEHMLSRKFRPVDGHDINKSNSKVRAISEMEDAYKSMGLKIDN